jgi:hypothetical protein
MDPKAIAQRAKLARFCMPDMSSATPPKCSLAFWSVSQDQGLQALQTEPKIISTDHPILNLQIEAEGHGQLRDKARLVLIGTYVGVTRHSFIGDPKCRPRRCHLD